LKAKAVAEMKEVQKEKMKAKIMEEKRKKQRNLNQQPTSTDKG